MSKMPDLKDDAFQTALRSSKLGAEIQLQIDEQLLQERRTLADERGAIDAEAARVIPKSVEDCEAAAAKVKKLEQQLQEARWKLGQLVGARTGLSASFSQRRAEIEKRLRDTAHPAIADAQAWARDEIAKTRKAVTTRVSHDENFVTGRRTEIVHSNAAQLNARTAGLRGMLEALGDLALEVVDADIVLARIDAMNAALPTIGD